MAFCAEPIAVAFPDNCPILRGSLHYEDFCLFTTEVI